MPGPQWVSGGVPASGGNVGGGGDVPASQVWPNSLVAQGSLQSTMAPVPSKHGPHSENSPAPSQTCNPREQQLRVLPRAVHDSRSAVPVPPAPDIVVDPPPDAPLGAAATDPPLAPGAPVPAALADPAVLPAAPVRALRLPEFASDAQPLITSEAAIDANAHAMR